MDETALLIQKAQNGDIEAKSRLVSQNSALIWSIVKKFAGRGYDLEDLFQTGAIGLIKSIDRFDLSYNVKFSTYAVPMILGEIKRFLRDDGIVKVSRSTKALAVKAKLFSQSYYVKNGCEPTISEMAKELETDEDELIIALESTSEVESLYRKVTSPDSGKETFLIDKFNNASDDSDEIMVLRSALNDLTKEEKQIILMRYFDDKTQSEIGRILNRSQVQVSRMEKKILFKIKEKLV